MERARSLAGFFLELMMAPASSRGISQDLISYLSFLLSDPRWDRRGPLCLAFGDPSVTSSPIKLKELGDQALFVSGFFWDHLEARGLSLRYYAGLGSEAYSRFSLWVAKPGKDTFSDLSSRFSTCQSVLRDVRERCDRMERNGRPLPDLVLMS